MPEGEEMFQYHGYSGKCPNNKQTLREEWEEEFDVMKETEIREAWFRYSESLEDWTMRYYANSTADWWLAKLEAQRTADLEAIREGMPKEKICIHRKNWDGKTQLRPCECVFGEVGGFNECRSKVLSLIEQIMNKKI